MHNRNRRAFLADVGSGMLVASLGPAMALELGLAPALADAPTGRVTFGGLEPLVSLMQEATPQTLLPQLVEKLNSGASLKTLTAGAALANIRAFAGQDYTGFHTFMAMIPALHMSAELPREQQALPVLKVIYRNTSRITDQGANHKDALDQIEPVAEVDAVHGGEQLQAAVRAVDWKLAEGQFAAHVAKGTPGEAFNHLQYAVQDEIDVHRIVLSWRSFDMLGVAGEEYAHTLLRQSVRYCLDVEERMKARGYGRSPVRECLPKLLDQYKLLDRSMSERPVDNVFIEELAATVFSGSREQAAEAVAAALADGVDTGAIAEAISLAANQLVLHDPGRRKEYSSAQKPPGCVHGDSVGVHASDAANAWRHIALASSPRNKVASLIVAAFHTAGQGEWVTRDAYPYAPLLDEIRAKDADSLLGATEEAIRGNDQARACALVHCYGELKLPARPVFDLLLKYAVSEDGALHAEKFYRTASEEFENSREAFRWRRLVALARVTASEYGFPAPGYAEARDLLRLS